MLGFPLKKKIKHKFLLLRIAKSSKVYMTLYVSDIDNKYTLKTLVENLGRFYFLNRFPFVFRLLVFISWNLGHTVNLYSC